MMLSDNIQTMSTTYIEENTRLHFGLFPPKKTYDTRCYKPRYANIYEKAEVHPTRFTKITTTKVLRLQEYESPLDDTTTEIQKEKQWQKGEKIWKN